VNPVLAAAHTHLEECLKAEHAASRRVHMARLEILRIEDEMARTDFARPDADRSAPVHADSKAGVELAAL